MDPLSRYQQLPEETLARRVIGAAMKVHRSLGCGFLESIYRKALMIELRHSGISYECHPTFAVHYEGEEVGSFQADLVIEARLVVELKAVDTLAPIHSFQLINYLNAARIDEGLLINFGAKSPEFRTKTRRAPTTFHLEDLLP